MERGKPSRTALNAAVRRAVHQLVDVDPKVLVDPVIVHLVNTADPGAIDAGLQTLTPRDQPATRGLFAMRSRYAEDELAAVAAQGVT